MMKKENPSDAAPSLATVPAFNMHIPQLFSHIHPVCLFCLTHAGALDALHRRVIAYEAVLLT